MFGLNNVYIYLSSYNFEINTIIILNCDSTYIRM